MTYYDKHKNETEQLKEDFCPSCLITPLAFVGTGAVVAGGTIPKRHKKWKKAMLISGIISFVSLLAILLYFFFYKKKCDGTCSFKV